MGLLCFCRLFFDMGSWFVGVGLLASFLVDEFGLASESGGASLMLRPLATSTEWTIEKSSLGVRQLRADDAQ